jgi:hypothetical protein
MGEPETIGLTVLGVALIALVLADIFATIFHVQGRGPIARSVLSAIWTVFRRTGNRRMLVLAGPAGLLIAVGTWALGLTLGWALLLWPYLETGFAGSEASTASFWDSLHLSLTSLTTLGSLDLVAEEEWLRIVSPLEALLGFGLLSASISYLLLLYPALARRRALAYKLFLLCESERREGPLADRLGGASAERLCASLADEVAGVERDLIGFPGAYYFAEADERFSLPASAPYALSLARPGARWEGDPAVRLRIELLRAALEDLAQTLAARYPRTAGDSPESVFTAYARDHRVSPLSRSG